MVLEGASESTQKGIWACACEGVGGSDWTGVLGGCLWGALGAWEAAGGGVREGAWKDAWGGA